MKGGFTGDVAGVGKVGANIDQNSKEWLVIAIAGLGVLFLLYWFAKQEIWSAGQAVKGALPDASGIASGIGETASGITSGIGETVSGIASGIGETASGIASGASLTWEGYLSSIGAATDQAGRNLQEAAGRAPEVFSDYMKGVNSIMPPYSPAAYLTDIAAGAPEAIADTLRSWGIWK